MYIKQNGIANNFVMTTTKVLNVNVTFFNIYALNRFLILCEDLLMRTTYPAELVEATIVMKMKRN